MNNRDKLIELKDGLRTVQSMLHDCGEDSMVAGAPAEVQQCIMDGRGATERACQLLIKLLSETPA